MFSTYCIYTLGTLRILYFDTHTSLSNVIIQRISSQGSILTKLGKSVKIEEDDDFM